jgi:hypothetical protein
MTHQEILAAIANMAPKTEEAARYKAECHKSGWAVSKSIVDSLNKSGKPLPDYQG